MKMNQNVKTVLWNQNMDHHSRYKSIGDIFYMIRVDKFSAMASSVPFTIDMGLLLICFQGEVEVGVDMQVCHLHRNDMIVVLPGQIIDQRTSSEDFKGLMMLYSTSFFTNLNFPVNFPLVMYDISKPLLSFSEEQFCLIRSYCTSVEEICDASIRPVLKNDVFKYLCMSLMYAFKDEIERFSAQEADMNRVVSKKFLRVLAANFREHRDLQFYADELHLSKKYFSVLIKNETGRTASEWIEEFIILEATKLLATTDYTIQEVSIAMNFANQSFFGKFFKRMTGMSPKAYRKSLLDE